MFTLCKRRARRFVPALIGLLLLCLLLSCGTTDTPPSGETGTESQTDIDTPPAEAPDETIPETIPETIAETETETEVATVTGNETDPIYDLETIPETEPETEFHPDSSTSPATILFDGDSILSYITATGCAVELFDDDEAGRVLKVQVSGRPVNHVVLDYEAYMTAKGLSPIAVEDYRFAVITLKTGTGYGGTHTSSTLIAGCAAGEVEECTVSNSAEASYAAKNAQWQTVCIDLRADGWSGELNRLLLSATLKTREDESYCISSIAFVDTVTMDMLEAPLITEVPVKGLAEPFTILQITDLHACAVTDEELAAMTASRAADVKNRFAAFWGSSAFLPEDILTAVNMYAEEIGAGLIVATGDIIDFPSEGNLSLLAEFVTSSSTPVLYMAGNHDWCFSDDYMTQNAIDTYLPRISALANAQNGVSVYEAGGITFVTVDNSSDTISSATWEAYLAAVSAAREKGNAVILSLHVPFTADTLVADCKRVWNRNICIGPGGISDWHEPTMNLFRAVTEGTEYAPDVVLSGHVHFSHEDVFPNGVPQIITADASGDGLCRVIRFVPAESETVS